MYKFFKNRKLRAFFTSIILFNFLFQNLIFATGIEVGSGTTTLDTAANGVQVINIANPNQNGVSHNDFEKYNVGQQGVIVNNSTEMGTSQLGGIVDKNNNLDRSANTIIAEVSGSEKSNIEGYTEIFGKSADFILANPNGIFVNGAGFINSSKVTLTTGKVNLKDNGEIIFNIKNGKIMVGDIGINLEETDYFDIISRVASITGNIYGKKEVNIITGTNDYNYNTGEYKSNESDLEKPEISIDTSALSGIYAGKIKFISTEKGVGINSNSDVVADASDVIIDANGNIVLKNTYAKNEVKIENSGNADLQNIQSENTIKVETNGNLKTNGIVSENIDINSINLENNGVISAKEEIALNVDKEITNNKDIQSKDLIIKSKELNNKGIIGASDKLAIASDNLNNSNRIQSLNDLEINTKVIENNGVIVGQNSSDINTDVLNNDGIISSEKSLTLKSLGSVNNTGEISSNEKLIITTPKLDNSGKIIGIETYEIDSKDINLSGILGGGIGHLKTDNLYISSSGELITDSGEIVAKLIRIEGTIFSEKDLSISSNEINNTGEIQGSSNLIISANKIENSKDIKTAKDIYIQGKEINNSGQIISKNDIKIEGVLDSNLKNEGTIAGFNNLEILKIDTIENTSLGILYGKKDLLIDNNGKIINSGKINGVENVTINSKGIENTGSILGGKGISLLSDYLNNTGKIISSEEIDLNIVNYILNSGEIKGKNIKLKSNILANTGYILANTLNLEVYNLTNQLNSYIQGEESLNFMGYSFINNGSISSLNSLVLSSNSFLNNKDIQSNGSIVINSTDEINNNGLISSLDEIDLNAANLIKNSGTINSNDLKANAKSIDNTGKILIANNADIKADKLNNSNQIAVANDLHIKGNVNNSGDIFQLSETGDILFEQGTVENSKNILAKGDINSLNATSLSNKGNIISETGDISIKNLNNEKGVIQAENNIKIQNDSELNNKDGIIASLSETGLIDVSVSGLNNSNGKIVGNNEVSVDINGDFVTSGEIQGIEKTYLEGNTLKILTNLKSNNIELKSYFDTIIENQIYGVNSVVINSEGNITNNKKISSFNNIELVSLKNFLNKGSLLSNNALSIIGGNITNSSLIFGKNQIVLKSDGKIYNSETILSSEGNMFIEGNKNNRASEFENYTGTLEAGEGISIKSNEVKNVGVVEGSPTLYFVKERELPENEWEGELGRYQANNATFTIDEASIKGNNIYIEGNNLNNYGSLIGGANSVNIQMDGSVNNQTPVYSKYLSDYILKGKVWLERNIESGDSSDDHGHGDFYYERETKTWSEGGTISIEAKEKAQIIAGNNLTIKGSYVGNGVQQKTSFSNTANNKNIEITDSVLEKVKSTGTINVVSSIELPKGEFGLFKINDEFTNKEVEGIQVSTTNVELKNDNHVVDVETTEVQSMEREKPNYHYLVETNIEFLDLSRYYGSDYFFNKIGFNPGKDININLLGDSYYETQLVNEAIQKTIGKQYLYDDVYSDSDQMKILYDNAQTVMSDLNLTVGVELTKEQINNLNKDLIWLVEKVVDGHKVLAPQLYLCQGTLENLTVEGSILKAGNNLNIVANTVNNTGNITANNVYVKASDISNISVDGIQSQIAGNTVTLIAKNDILNSGATIIGNESVDIFAEGRVVFDTVKNYSKTSENGRVTESITNTVSNIVGGDISIMSGKDLISKGANISGTGKVDLSAKGNIVLDTAEDIVTVQGKGYENKKITNTVTNVSGSDINISSAGNIVMEGTNVEAENNIGIAAAENILITDAKDSEYTKTVEKSKKMLSSKTTTTETYDEESIASNIAGGGNISIKSGKDISIIGSNVINTGSDEDNKGNIDISATGDVRIAESRELHLSSTVVEKKGFAVSFDKDNLTLKAGIETNKTTTENLSDLAKSSELFGSNLNLGGEEVTLQGANVTANGDVNITADILNVLEAKDISKSETKTETTFVGLTVSANSDILNIGDNLKQLTNLDALKGNMSSIINGGFGAVDGLRGVANGINAVPDVSGNNEDYNQKDSMSKQMSVDKQAVKDLASVSFGITHTTEESGQISETSVGSNINAQSIKISSKKDTTIQGSNLNATKDITIEADNLNILASTAKTTSYSDSKTESLSIGISVDNENKANLGGVTGSLSKNKSESESITNTNSTLNAGGNLKVTTANDLTIKGGVVKADTVDLTVGNNLTIESVQDTEKSNNSSFSASLTVSVGSGSANGSLNMQKGYVDNAWVNGQSGITAANGGSIKVANNTDIKGAIIASDNKDKAIEIDTKTFTYENIKDKQEGKTTGFGISGGTTGGVPATSIQYASNDKRQDTNATLSNVSLTVNGEKVDPNTIGINTDLSQAQVITKDERVDMIDINLQTDLANKEERDKIRDAKDKVEDVAKTVENVIDKGNVGGIKENYVNNRFATRGANAVEDDPKLSKALENFETLSPEQKYTVMLKLADTMYKANGFNKGPNIIVTDTKDTQRGLDTGTIYINLEQLSSFSAGDLVNAIAHESSHSEVLGESEENFAIEKGNRAKDKFDSSKDTGDVDLGGYLTDLEAKYAKEKIRLAEVKEKLPEEKGEEFTQYVAPIALQAEQIFMDVATKYGTIIANKLQELYYVYGPVVLEAVSTGGQKLVEYLSSKGGDSATGGNFDPNDPKWKEIINKNVEWTNHGYKHFPNKNTSWKDIVKSTKDGPAKYSKDINVETIERTVWENGQTVSNGKTWKVMKFDKVIGASGGKETSYMRVEFSGGTIHGHPITELEYIKLLK